MNPFHNTRYSERGRPGDPETEARRSIAPAQPAVQPAAAQGDDPAGGFDIRLVRVQPGVHLNTEQTCDVVYATGPEAIAPTDSSRYDIDAAHRMPVSCQAATGAGWADLVFSPEDGSLAAQVESGRRIRIRILTADGGSDDYPVVQFVSLEGDSPALARPGPRTAPTHIPNGFDLGRLEDDPGLIGSTQECAVLQPGQIELVRPADRGRRSYPAGVQNRMTVHCKHRDGEASADLVFMPAQALAALTIESGSMVPVRIISRSGGAVDYPILQFAGQ